MVVREEEGMPLSVAAAQQPGGFAQWIVRSKEIDFSSWLAVVSVSVYCSMAWASVFFLMPGQLTVNNILPPELA